MALSVGGKSNFSLYVDHHPDDSCGSSPALPPASSLSSPLRCLPVAQVQNRQRGELFRPCVPPCLDNTREEPAVGSNTTSRANHPTTRGPRHETTQQRRRASARAPSALETVPEDASSSFGSTSPSHEQTYRYLELSARYFPGHPILTAACATTSAESQHQKHRNRNFEWVLAIDQSEAAGPTPEIGSSKKLLLGCNLIPQSVENSRAGQKAQKVLLLATPLEEGEDNLSQVSTVSPHTSQIVAVPDGENKISVMSTTRSDKDTSLPRFVITESDPIENRSRDSPIEIAEDGSVTRIEDSFEALDKLEEQLEAFDKAAIFKRVTISKPQSRESAGLPSPSPRQGILKSGSASTRSKPVSKTGQPTLRKSSSMGFDTRKVKNEEKSLIQATSKVSQARASSVPAPKPMVKSSKPPTIPSFELPGEATFRRLKEQREARAAAQLAEEVAAHSSAQNATLRRSKSARMISLPTFELPGEAISRRKREERARQLKAQEEEERRRREFKARPIGLTTVPASVPRDTVASRARQVNKGASSENDSSRPAMPINHKRSSLGASLAMRGPLQTSSNQDTLRGRPLACETRQNVRAVSHASSTGSTEHSSTVSAEDIEQQRRKGEGVYRRDSSYAKDREVERREREDLARLARAEAAERSRQQSREWALKQARKRMTIGSLRELQT